MINIRFPDGTSSLAAASSWQQLYLILLQVLIQVRDIPEDWCIPSNLTKRTCLPYKGVWVPIDLSDIILINRCALIEDKLKSVGITVEVGYRDLCSFIERVAIPFRS